MTSVIDRLKTYYTLEDDNGRLLVWKPDSSEPLRIYKTQRKIRFTFGRNVSSETIAEEIAKGNVIEIESIELYRQFYGWDDETYVWEKYGMDMRTYKYFRAFKNRIGYVDTEHGNDFWTLAHPEKLDIFTETTKGSGELGTTNDGLWCYQFAYKTDIDDFNVEKILFKRRPRIEDIRWAHKIHHLEVEFRLHQIEPVFKCWECGAATHWLDIDEDFINQIDKLYQRYCGC